MSSQHMKEIKLKIAMKIQIGSLVSRHVLYVWTVDEHVCTILYYCCSMIWAWFLLFVIGRRAQACVCVWVCVWCESIHFNVICFLFTTLSTSVSMYLRAPHVVRFVVDKVGVVDTYSRLTHYHRIAIRSSHSTFYCCCWQFPYCVVSTTVKHTYTWTHARTHTVTQMASTYIRWPTEAAAQCCFVLWGSTSDVFTILVLLLQARHKWWWSLYISHDSIL